MTKFLNTLAEAARLRLEKEAQWVKSTWARIEEAETTRRRTALRESKRGRYIRSWHNPQLGLT